MSTKTRTYRETTTPASEPLQAGKAPSVRFSFRSAPRRYTAALAILAVLVVLLLLALVVVILLSGGDDSNQDTGETVFRGGLFFPLGPRSLACRDMYMFACAASAPGAIEDKRCGTITSMSRRVTTLMSISFDSKEGMMNSTLLARIFYRACLADGNGTPRELFRLTGVDLLSAPVTHQALFNSTRYPVLERVIVNASVPLFFRITVREATPTGNATIAVSAVRRT